jgi:hypothetical protein
MIDTRMPEHGRIRLGIETTFANGKRGPKAIDTFRFTSPDRNAIEILAQQYGGTVRPWHNDKATIVSAQWEVITTSSEMVVLLPPGAITISFEIWGGGGIERRCDGHTAELYRGDDTSEVACLCLAAGARECKPYTRMKVILPEVPFGGVWRLESHGENAAAELPAMQDIIRVLQRTDGLLPAKVTLETRTMRKGGRKKIYVVPRLSALASAADMLSGSSNIQLAAPRRQIELASPTDLIDGRVVAAKPAHLDMTDEAFEEALVRTCHTKGVDVDLVLEDLASGVARIVQVNTDGTLRLGRGRT